MSGWLCDGRADTPRPEAAPPLKSRRCSASVRLLVAGMLCALLACLAAGRAQASVMVAADAREAALRVDAAGDAEVTWTAGAGGRRSLVIGRNGALRFGGGLAGGDVSHPTSAVAIPMARVVRQTPDGSFYALQAWRRLPGGPVELRFSRWRGEPTKLTLQAVCCKWGSENVQGTASFQGRPIFGQHSTSQGVPLDPFGRNVYLDTFRGGHWQRMMGILTHRPTGFFSLWIRPFWLGTRYRGTMIGPNWGGTLGPDVQAETASSRH